MFRNAEVVYLCLVCILWQFSMVHALQFVDAGRECKMRPYRRAGLMTALKVAMSVSFCSPHPVAVSAFMICSGLCACTRCCESVCCM